MTRLTGIFGAFASIVFFAGCHTTPPAAPGCKANSECAAGEVCNVGTMKCEKGTMCTANTMCKPGEECKAGVCVVPDRMCEMSNVCAGGMVCRNKLCVAVPCSMSMPCMANESCKDGKCSPSIPQGKPGRTLASGGSVSTNGKYIHIGLTGQGRAVGAGASPTSKHQGGATAVMQR